MCIHYMALEKKWTLLDDMNLAQTSKNTYKTYFKKLFDFCKIEEGFAWHNLDSQEKMLELADDHLQEMFERFLDHEKQRVKENLISPNTVPKYFKPYKLLLDANYREHAVKWKPISIKYPPAEKRSGYKPWSTPQIGSMINKCDNWKKEALVMFQASTGSRVGVHNHPLLMKHMVKMQAPGYDYHCYAILIYAEQDESVEEKDQRILNDDLDSKDYSFFVFLIPEAAYALDQYHKERQDEGEVFVADTPIFKGSDTHASAKNRDFYQFSGNAFRHLMESLVDRANIQRVKKRNRYDVMLDHGFRKRFNTILKIDNEVNSNIAEKLMQHKKGLDGTYLTPTRQECFNEFLKAIPELTIASEERQRIKIAEQKQTIDELAKKDAKISQMEKTLEKLVEEKKSLTKQELSQEKANLIIKYLQENNFL